MGVTLEIVLPTVAGREESLERCIEAYRRTSPPDTVIHVIRDEPTCGAAWNAGLEKVRGEFVHFSADDLEPHAGWLAAALAIVHSGALPAPRVLNADGSLQSCGDVVELPDGAPTTFSRIPFLPTAIARGIFPISPIHYYTDNIVSDRARALGLEPRVARGYLFTHHHEPAGRLDDRFAADGAAYASGGAA